MGQERDSRFIKWFWDQRLDENTYTIIDADGFIVAALIPTEDLVASIVRSHNAILDQKLPLL